MERYRFDEKIKASLENLRAPLAVYQFLDKRVVTLVLSAGFCALFGFSDRADAYRVMDNDMYRDTHPDDAARIADAAFRFATQGGKYEVIYRTKTFENPEYRIIHAIGEHVYTEEGVRLAYVWYTDEGAYLEGQIVQEADTNTITSNFSKALHEESIFQASYYDYLTGLPSMTYFFQLAEAYRNEMLEQGIQPVLVYLDLNGMKFYNRKYGFAEGDILLRGFANILKKHFSNESCSRFGADHFTIMTREEGLEEKLKAIFMEFQFKNGDRSLPIRAGIYKEKDNNGMVDVSTACDRAKFACNASRNPYVLSINYFSDEMLAETLQRQYIIDHLDQAIAENWIQVYYQPIIRAANGRVCDEEALARWIDPEKGRLSPDDFIPYLEEAKLIYKIDLYMVEQVLKKMKKQEEAGLYVVPESVNLSRSDFDACDMVEEICSRVDAAGVSRDKLTIEITESVIGSDFDYIKEQVERFQALGFQVWMDDFGSGYSSLDVLQSIHFDLIKFDMRFMNEFENGDNSKIILSELIRMAIGLGVDTVCEGVETKEQVEFLREVGCTKLQGYYYGRPISMEEIFEKYRKGTQIGFENPNETGYYAAIGKVNLYDLAVVSNNDEESFQHYFNTLPMAIIESKNDEFLLVRCNNTYRTFMDKMFGVAAGARNVSLAEREDRVGSGFLKALRECGENGNKILLDEEMADGATAHAFLKRIAVNPVTGTKALVVVVLAVIDAANAGSAVSFTSIAKALSSDYIYLYDVDLSTEKFVEYSSEAGRSDISMERHGEDFFAASRRDAVRMVYAEDQQALLKTFTRENVIRAMDEYGAFTFTYRLMIGGAPTYVNMKAVRLNAENHIIIGVSNVDALTRQKEALERVQEEQITYARISALAGDFICIYTVNPETEHYLEYSATKTYEGMGFAKTGEKFFEQARKDGARTVFPEDMDLFKSGMTKEKMLADIRENGVYSLTYRLMIEGEPRYVCLKAAMVEEKDGPQLIVGVQNIDAQVKREQEFEYKLTNARNKVNLDPLTGVKSRSAFDQARDSLDRQIGENEKLPFAVTICRITDNNGHTPGDSLIKEGCYFICNIFKHSPVFRLSADEFAVIIQGHDYEQIDELTESLKEANTMGNAFDISFGMARRVNEKNASMVVENAGKRMK